MTIITCTFDADTHKVVPIEAAEEIIQAGCLNQQEGSFETYSEWQNSHSSGVVHRIRTFCAGDYKAMIKEAPPYPADTGWIPCSERLPDREGYFDVFVRTSGASIYNGRQADVLYCHSRWQAVLQYGQYVSHWRELPAAPKGE